jgi:hypothetical protein
LDGDAVMGTVAAPLSVTDFGVAPHVWSATGACRSTKIHLATLKNMVVVSILKMMLRNCG